MNCFNLGREAAAIKQAGIPWGAIGEGALQFGKGVGKYGVPAAAGGLTTKELYDKGYPMETALTEGAAASLVANPALWSHYKGVGAANLARKGITNPNFWTSAEATGMAAKNPIKFKALLGAMGLIPMAGSTMKDVKDISGQAAMASKDLPKITGKVSEGVGNVMQNAQAATYGVASASDKLNKAVGDVSEGINPIMKNLGEATNLKGVNSAIEGAAVNLKDLLGGANKSGKDITDRLSEIMQAVGTTGAGNLEHFARSQADINDMLTKYVPRVAVGALGIGGLYATAKLIEALRSRGKSKKKVSV